MTAIEEHLETGRSTRSRSRLLRIVAVEAAALVATTALAIAVLARVLGTDWLHFFLYDGDSLALPLLAKSIASGEPFQWIMTSQLLIFPEAPLYALSALVGRTPQTALLINAVLNIVVFAVLLRVVSGYALAARRRVWRIGAAFLGTATFLVMILSEGRTLNNVGALATTYLLTTYYSGVIVSALALIALTFWFTRGLHRDAPVVSWRSVVFAVVGIVIAGGTTLSNPLFVMQFVAPFLVTIVVLWLLGRWRSASAVVVALVVVVGTGVGYASREVFARYIAADAGTYFHLDRAGAAVQALRAQFGDVASTTAGKIELLLVVGLLVLAVLGSLASVYASSRPGIRFRIADSAAFVFVFVTVSATSLLVGQIISGSLVSRYLVPLAAFTPLVVIALLGTGAVAISARWVSRILPTRLVRIAPVVVGSVVVVASLGAGAIGAPVVARTANDVYASPDADCLETWLDGRDLDGVGSFWTTRPLELYGPADIDVQQVNWDFSAQLWMSNVSSFDDKDYSYALIDHAFGREPDWTPFADATLGAPASITSCDSFEIYDYAGTAGETTLNTIIDDSIAAARSSRNLQETSAP